MDDRAKTFYSVLPVGAVVAAILTSTGCGLNQQTKFQMSFLPSAPHASALDPETLARPPRCNPIYSSRKTPHSYSPRLTFPIARPLAI